MHSPYMMGTYAQPKGANSSLMAGRDKPSESLQNAEGRRYLQRRSGLPRSKTLPVLAFDPDSATSSLVSSMQSAFALGPPVMTTPTKGPATPTSTESPTESTATEGRRKGFLHVFKSKGREQPKSSDSHTPMPSSPFPEGALRSPKALKVLGIPSLARDPIENVDPPESSLVGEGEAVGRYEIDGEDDGAMPVLKTLRKRASLPWLTRTQAPAYKETKFKEEMDDTDTFTPIASPSKGFMNVKWSQSSKKALRVLDLIPRPKSSGRDTFPDAPSLEDLNLDAGYHSDGDVAPRGPGPVWMPDRRGRRKKGPKSLERMSPITEMSSFGENGPPGSGKDNDAELEIITEYALQHDRAAFYRPSLFATVPLLPNFELRHNDDWSEDEGDTQSSEEDEEDGEHDEQHELEGAHFAAQGGTPEMVQVKSPFLVHIKSPLQDLERIVLNQTEEKLEMDAEKYRLEQEHVKMKTELININRRSYIPDENLLDSMSDADYGVYDDLEDDGNESDDVDSDIYTDEEPTVHFAEVLTFARVMPGMVKMVDIPPKKSNMYTFKSTKGIGSQTKPAIPGKSDRREVARLRGGREQPPFTFSPFDSTRKNRLDPWEDINPNKAKLPRQESRNLITGWMETATPVALRPISMRFDPHVLAERCLDRSPAPPPKGPSPRGYISKHYCLYDGHEFQQINLRDAPDDIFVNDLQVSPYLRTPGGIKQHVRIPIACEKCGHDVNEQFLQCKVPLCGLVVCYACYAEIQKAREGRSPDSFQKDEMIGKAI